MNSLSRIPPSLAESSPRRKPALVLRLYEFLLTAAKSLSPYNLALGIVGQESLMLWLLVMGVNEQRWKEQASPAVE